MEGECEPIITGKFKLNIADFGSVVKHCKTHQRPYWQCLEEKLAEKDKTISSLQAQLNELRLKVGS